MPRPEPRYKATDGYVRLSDLSPVPSDAEILWGVPVKAVALNRYMLHPKRGEGKVPYAVLSKSDRNAVRVVEEGTLDARAARIAYLVERDGARCFYCAREVEPAQATVEHLIPLALGGPDHACNLVLACSGCNAAAGSLPVFRKVQLAAERRAGVLALAVQVQALPKRRQVRSFERPRRAMVGGGR